MIVIYEILKKENFNFNILFYFINFLEHLKIYLTKTLKKKVEKKIRVQF